MSRTPFLTVYGHVSIDEIINLREFPEINTSVDIVHKKKHLGGTGGNIAIIAASLGVPTAICSFVGNDFPEEFEERMRSSGLILDELIKVEDLETSTALIVNNSHNDQITYFYQGPMGIMDSKNVLTGMAKKSQIVHFSTGNPDYYIRVMELLEEKEITISLDPAQEIHRIWDAPRFCEATTHSDILFANGYEMKSALKYHQVSSIEEIPVKTVICTNGSEGSTIYQEGKLTKIPCIKSETVKDTTGAGDAYRAGFYAGLFHGYSTEKAALIGSATASFIVESLGSLTNIPTWEMVLSRAKLNE